MKKDDIDEIRIDVTAEEQLALSVRLLRDGTLGRRGSGAVPAEGPAVFGITDGRCFTELMELVDERFFEFAGAYDHPEKHGAPITYTVVFRGPKPDEGEERQSVAFRVSVGTEHEEVHPVVRYLDTLSTAVIALTEEWYQDALKGQTGPQPPGER